MIPAVNISSVPTTQVESSVRSIGGELQALCSILPAAYARQWEASAVPKPREDTPQRASGDRPSDPTGDTVLDARRLALRASVVRAERAVVTTVAALRAARCDLELALSRYDGPQ